MKVGMTVAVVVYLVDAVVLWLFGAHLLLLMWWAGRFAAACRGRCGGKVRRWPRVTVQIPLYNEPPEVTVRVIDAVMALDYPKDRLQVQVLDDSTDGTEEATKAAVERWRRRGYDIAWIHRTERRGYKGGALREALPGAKGEFVAIFDADFVPAREFLKATVPVLMEDPKVGMVQTRWGHLNLESSLLTRAQALTVDGHFFLDQVGRSGRGLFINFNGTAGIWRKACILEAGNWQDDTLTEDFDLSYRAELKGWRFRYLADVESPGELPETVTAYKSQQFRWAKGSIQTALKLLRVVWASDAPWLTKGEASFHLTGYLVHPLMVLNILLTPAVLRWQPIRSAGAVAAVLGAVWGMATTAPVLFYAYGQYVSGRKDWLRRLLWIPALVLVGTGIAVNNTVAILEALMGRGGEFVRTPKSGSWGWRRGRVSRAKSSTVVAVGEWLMAAYAMGVLVETVMGRHYWLTGFFVVYTAAFLWMAVLTLWETAGPVLLRRTEPARMFVRS